MQSQLALTAAKLHKLARNKYLVRRSLATRGGAEGRTADPDVHAIDPEDSYPEGRPLNTPTKDQPPIKEMDPFVSPSPPHSPSSKLESNPVGQPNDPMKQHRRRYSVSEDPFKDVSCVGVDGTPWPEDEMDRETQIRERVKDDKEYFEKHRASPLSEIEIADRRKPLTRATDGSLDEEGEGGGDGGMVADTAEETLERARLMWLESAMRGDPESPHGRVLRELRGENF